MLTAQIQRVRSRRSKICKRTVYADCLVQSRPWPPSVYRLRIPASSGWMSDVSRPYTREASWAERVYDVTVTRGGGKAQP